MPIDKVVSELMILVNSRWAQAARRARLGGRIPLAAGRPREDVPGRVRPPGAGVCALRLGELAAAALRRPDQPAPADRARARRVRPCTSATARRCSPRCAISSWPTKSTPTSSARWSATGACAGSCRKQCSTLSGRVIRDSLVRLERLPLVLRVPSVPDLPATARVELGVTGVDLIELDAGMHLPPAPGRLCRRPQRRRCVKAAVGIAKPGISPCLPSHLCDGQRRSCIQWQRCRRSPTGFARRAST